MFFINKYNTIIRRNIEHISDIKRIIQGKALYYAIIFIVFKQVILSEVHLDISTPLIICPSIPIRSKG